VSEPETIEHLRQALEQERSGRRETEAVLDAMLQATSEDLHRKNRDLIRLNVELEGRVRARTAELARAMSRAERADEAKSAFLALISHEIRTPMNGVLGMLEVLRAGRLDPEQARCLRTAHQSALSLLRMIDDLLDLSKIEAGMLELEALDFDLPALLRDTIQLWTAEARRRHLALELLAAPDIPRFVTGDPTRLRQVLSNLLSNALKFTAHGAVRVRVETSEEPADPEQGRSEIALSFTVSDTGMGIAPDARELLFTPFAQADGSIGRRFGGTGLGLAICKQLVTMMGGEITVDSAPGAGSRFTFTLPFAAAAAPASAAAAERSGRARASRRYSAAVLVADDNPVNREVAGALLAAWGCVVSFAADGQGALDSVRGHRPDIVLMDCQMPQLDGLAATREIRAWERTSGQPRRLPIIGVSAAVAREQRARAGEAGMDDLIEKPLGMQAVGRMLEQWAPASARAAPEAPAPARPATSKDDGRARGERLRASAFDEAQVAEMRAAAGAEFAGLVARFEVSAREQILEVRAAIDRGDAQGVLRPAHKLKGAASSLGARRLARTCARLLRLARTGSLPEAARIAQRLQRELAGTCAHLREAAGAVAPDEP
jgi:signal transduction histidine kinase/CheY-like chemotaxis protein/HPt (histidine-containing phosphotransfer) domain-containing protein